MCDASATLVAAAGNYHDARIFVDRVRLVVQARAFLATPASGAPVTRSGKPNK